MEADARSKTERLNDFVRKLEDVPTIPATAHRIITLIDDPRSSVSDLEKVISQDQTATAKLLKLANSAFYGFSRRVATTHQAIIVIGLNAVKSMVIGLSVFGCFRTRDEQLSELLNGLWAHSLAVATMSKEIALRTRLATPESAFVCGLLHDFGKALLIHQEAQRYHKVLEIVASKQAQLHKVEELVYGFHHADLGGWITERWQLPVEIVSAARDHHLAPSGEASAAAKIVNLANALVHEAKIGFSGYDNAPPPSLDVMTALGLDDEVVNMLRAYLRDEQPKIGIFLEVMTSA